MHLMGHDEPLIADIKQLAKQLPVLADGLLVVTTVVVDVELGIAACAEAPFTGRAEGYYVFVQVII